MKPVVKYQKLAIFFLQIYIKAWSLHSSLNKCQETNQIIVCTAIKNITGNSVLQKYAAQKHH